MTPGRDRLLRLLASAPGASVWDEVIVLVEGMAPGQEQEWAIDEVAQVVRRWPQRLLQPPERWLRQWEETGQPPTALRIIPTAQRHDPEALLDWLDALERPEDWRLAFARLAMTPPSHSAAQLCVALRHAVGTGQPRAAFIERLARLIRLIPAEATRAVPDLLRALEVPWDAPATLRRSAGLALVAMAERAPEALTPIRDRLQAEDGPIGVARIWMMIAALSAGLNPTLTEGTLPDALGALLHAPDQGDEVLAEAAIAALERHGHDAVMLAAAEALLGAGRSVARRVTALEGLEALTTDQAEPLLRRLLDDPAPRIRVGALVELGRRGAETAHALDAVLAVLQRPERDWVRAAAARCVRRITPPRRCAEVLPVMEAMSDEVWWVQDEIQTTVQWLKGVFDGPG